ncbi:MAG: RHS repeat protein, partial [Proteobacteria bacterium]|nr:RHS repeat protein [Pseudomonadota bacterium]
WTYNAQQLVETATEPNGAVTTYTYDTFGNVLTATNALGHVTSYTYDAANRVASMTAPNGLATTYTYDLRDRLLTQTVGGAQTTTFTYNPTGTLATLALPTGLVVNYTYDPAHRLIGWSNNRGEQGSFTLDGMGNRTAEQIKDASGAVAFTVARSINNINRVASTTEGSGQTNVFGYDANGDLTSQTNALNQSTRWGLDNLRRVKTITNAANATAGLTRNGLDDVVQATDFKGVATSYGRDALGNATSEASNDSGVRSTQYDGLGLPVQIIDALGQATQIQRDALGRPVVLTFADGQSTTLSYDLASTGNGYLSQIVDRSGTTTYTRDGFGRVTLKQQSLISGQTLQVGYAYYAGGQLASITYPGGGVLSHVYDTTGRLARLDWNGTPLVSAITWNPLGQPTGWNWSFVTPGLNASRSYDTAGRLTATEFSGYVYNGAGRITSLTQQLFYPTDSDPTQSTITSGNASWTVSYDAVGRIIGFDNSNAGASDTASFSYDSNGNRTGSTRTLGGQTVSRTYSGDGASNHLLGFTQTGSVATSVNYAYNANGDLTGDGLRSYAYNAEGRLAGATTGATDTSPTTRYAYNALGQRVFKTEPLYPPAEGDESDPGFFATLAAFFQRLWSAPVTESEKLGYGYVYDEEGTLLAEAGTGGANSGGNAQYIWLPTASGPMPVAVLVNGTNFYAVHADHLNTPRRLTDASGQAVWQWAYSAFGEEKPTLAKWRFANLDITANPGTTSAPAIKFNLRYPGQYFDEESGLHYNYFRSYSPTSGRYTQADPIGLDGGWSRFAYVSGNPLKYTDPLGLQASLEDRPAATGPFVPNPSAAAQKDLAKRLDRIFCQEEPDCWDLQQRMEEVAGELRQRYVSMTGDAGNLFCTRPIGKFSWLGHQWKFGDKQRQLQKLIEQAQAKGCSVNGEYIKLASIDAPNCPAR